MFSLSGGTEASEESEITEETVETETVSLVKVAWVWLTSSVESEADVGFV